LIAPFQPAAPIEAPVHHRATINELGAGGEQRAPDDVACARPMGARTVAVATGFYKPDALRAAGATHVFDNLGDTQAVLHALFS